MNTLRRTLSSVRGCIGRRVGDEGQSLAEYALILAFVALAAIGALATLGNAIANSPGFDLFQ